VQISFETNEPRRVTFEAASSIIPPPEIDWDVPPKINMDSVNDVDPVLCFDDEVSTRQCGREEGARCPNGNKAFLGGPPVEEN
uniref:Uncharacterized protein n=1 Tax=Caenorhabditis japonica TaxID=281687 RepID=A0A8R1I6D0_CAEJA